MRLADQFVEVPGGANANNYANVRLIVQVAERAGVDAVWPGWCERGFAGPVRVVAHAGSCCRPRGLFNMAGWLGTAHSPALGWRM